MYDPASALAAGGGQGRGQAIQAARAAGGRGVVRCARPRKAALSISGSNILSFSGWQAGQDRAFTANAPHNRALEGTSNRAFGRYSSYWQSSELFLHRVLPRSLISHLLTNLATRGAP